MAASSFKEHFTWRLFQSLIRVLRKNTNRSGPLTIDWAQPFIKPARWTKKTRELVKLGIAVGARFEGSVHTHARRALEAGASPEEIRQVVLLAIPTMGFPPMMAAMTWVDDVLKSK